MEHRILATRETVHGVFDATLSPVVSAASGDRVIVQTLDAWWGLEPFPTEYGPRRTLESPDARQGHALTGPIALAGLDAGEVLEIRIESLTPGSYGFTEAGGAAWKHYRALGCDTGGLRMLLWDLAGGLATTTVTGRRLSVRMRLFLGVIGMPPSVAGPHSTTPPRPTGGNLDCTLLTAGSTLFLPAEVPGGLLSLGDGHAAQGDGEVSNNGIECGMDEVRLTLIRRGDLRLTTPLVRTPTAWATLGLGRTLNEAMLAATNAMLDLMAQRLGCSRVEALGLMSVAVDLRITQVVNGTVGVHAVWEDGAIFGGHEAS